MMRFLTFIFMFLAFPVMGQLRPNQFTTNVAGATGASNSLRHVQLFHPRFYNATSYLATAPGQPLTNFFYFGGIDSGAGGMPGMIDQYNRSILMCRKDVAHESDALFFGSTDTHWGAMTWDIQGAGWTTPTNLWPRFTTSFGSPGGQQAGMRFSQVNVDSINVTAWIEDPAIFAGTSPPINVWTIMPENGVGILIFGVTNMADAPTHMRGTSVQLKAATAGAIQAVKGGITNDITGRFYSQTALQTVTNTTSATTLLAPLVGSTFRTNLLAAALNVVGRTVSFDFSGRYSSAATPGTFTIDVALGATTVFTTGAITPAVSQTEKTWNLSGQVTTRATGASGTVMGWGNFTVGTNTTGVSVWQMVNATTTTHDLTAAQDIHVRATMSALTAPNNIQCQVGQMRLE